MQIHQLNSTFLTRQNSENIVGCASCLSDERQAANSNRSPLINSQTQLCCTRLCCLLFAVCAGLFAFNFSARAQSASNSGQIGGEVRDPAGIAVAGVEVTARNLGTNAVRNAVTDDEGRYAIGQLPLGDYEVSVKPANFEPASQKVYVSLGGRANAAFDLGLQKVQEAVEVTANPTGIEPSQTFSKAALSDVQLRNLPANGRRIRNLFLLTPATQIEPECGGFAISGQKGLFTSINVDGSDYTNTHWCGHVEFSPTFTIEALQEFQVLRSTFSAEFGRSTGGIINLATKSGTNEFNGSGYNLFRNRATTKLDPFGREQIGLGQQFGGSVGGPIIKNRTFFFSAAEFQINNKPVQVRYGQLDLLGFRNSPGAQALLAIAPEDKLIALSQSQSIVNRVDHRLNNNNNLTGRIDYTRNKVTDTAGSFILTQGIGADSETNRSVQNASPINNRTNVTGMMQLASTLSSRFVNEFRVQLAREFRPWNPGDGPEVTVRGGSPIQTIAIYGPQATGLAYGNIGYQFTDNRLQIINNLSFISGAHTVKVGFDSNGVRSNTTFNPGGNGIYRFDNLQNYLDRRPAQYQQFAGTGELDANIHQIAFYVQDEWRIARGVTVSPGFRYEMALLPDYPQATAPQNRFPLATSIPDDKGLIAPRLAMAWDVRNNAKTVVRAAAGIFYAAPYLPLFEQSLLQNGGNPELSSNVVFNSTNDILNAFQSQGIALNSSTPLNNLPVFTTAQLNNLSNPVNRINNGTIFFFDPNFRLPRAVQFRGAIEQEIAKGITASIDYTHINVSRIDRVRNLNLLPPTPNADGRPIYTNLSLASNAALRPFPKYAFAYVTESSARSLYRGMTATLNIRRPKFTVDATYTLGFSTSHDDHERGGFSSANYVDAYNLGNEYNWSNIDQRHQFAANSLIDLPFGFEVSTYMRFNTGRPFSARTGADSNNDGIVNDRPLLDGAVVRRNTFRNRGFADVSTRLQRSFNLPKERGKLAFSVEVFNLFNTDNVETTQFVYGQSLNAPPTNANFNKTRNANGDYLPGAALRTSPFQVQLGLRLSF